MHLPTLLFFRLPWFSVPGALLIALLQRTPILRVLATDSAGLAASPAVQLVRSVFTAAALGALHSRAGATTFIVTQGATQIINVSTRVGSTPQRRPATGTAGAALTPVALSYTGTPSPPQRYAITGQLPPGLRFTPAPVLGSVLSLAPVISGTPTQPGTFTVSVQGFGLAGNGSPEPIVFTITGDAAAAPPAFTTQPVSQSATVGSSVTFSTTTSGSPAPSYQWLRNGSPLTGATAARLTLNNVQATDAGDYAVVATNPSGTVTSTAATLTLITANAGARLSNLSVRTTMTAGQTLIVGLVVVEGARDVLVRAAGPALAAFGLASAMADPQLELYTGATRVLANDNWSATLLPVFASVGAFAFPTSSPDAAFVQSLNAAHSILARGSGPGTVLVEAYDTGAPSTARLNNVSARNRVGTGSDLLIAGFTIAGTGTKPLLIRAIGFQLNSFGVAGYLADPILEVFDASGTRLAENDNWSSALAPVFSSVGAFALTEGSPDAALLVTLPPGSFTAQVRGRDGGTGEALIEIYEVR
ncbi:MAG: hypothetical protein FJ399_09505 [Verrucomicrobia bacterium]|nr:hypothetical protein [Verrucomicrobiota bacterium]